MNGWKQQRAHGFQLHVPFVLVSFSQKHPHPPALPGSVKELYSEKDIESLQHTTWRCQYYVVFAPKYRRMVIYGQIKKDIVQILRTLCEQKDVGIIEAQACPDHIHMLLSIPPKYKSSLMIFDRHANLKYKDGDRLSCVSWEKLCQYLWPFPALIIDLAAIQFGLLRFCKSFNSVGSMGAAC